MAAGPRSLTIGLVAALWVLLAPGLAAANCSYTLTFTSLNQTVNLDTINDGGQCDNAQLGLAPSLNYDLGGQKPIGFTNINGTTGEHVILSPSSSPATGHATLDVFGAVNNIDTTHLQFTLTATGGVTTDKVTVFVGSTTAIADTPVDIIFNMPATGPTVTSVNPTAGSTAGGTSVTITGTGFDTTPANNTVKFGTTTATVNSASATSLTVTAPAHAAGQVDITVTTGGNTSATGAGDRFTFVAPPTISASFSPTTTAVGSTSTLTLTLSNTNSGGLTNLAESTTLPAGLTASPSPTNNCGGTASIGGGGVLNLSGGSLAGSSTCTIMATVTATSSNSKSVTPGGTAAPSGSQSATTFTGVSGSAAVLSVNVALSTTQAVPSTTLIANVAATPFTPVTASGGTPTVSFALSGGTLPTGLNFSTSTGQITGTPTATLATTTFTVTATDQSPTPQTSSKTFSLTVSAALTTTQAIAATNLTVNAAVTPFTPVTASGGTPTVSFALSGGTLPTGLNFSTSTGQITGTPTTTLATTTFTVTATDQTTPTPQTSSKTFSLAVDAALVTTQAVPSTTLTVNVAATAFTPVTASGGTGTISFALSGGTLPTGLNFSTSTGQITGTPTTTLSATTFTVTATDQSSPTPQTSSKTFSLTVSAAPVALSTTQAVASTTLTVNSAATPFTPVTASGGTGTISFALSGGTLPTGLNFSTSTGQITGTPTATLAATTFTVTATDQSTPTPATSSKTFSLTVNAALTTTQAVPSTTLTANVAATPFTPVTASGGTGSVSFALSGGTLPTGLNFSTSTGQITGTPTATLAATTFTVTATDQTTPTPQTSSKTFSLTVSAAPPALTTAQAVASTTLTVNSAATPFTPVTASGGAGTVSFALSGGTLPSGLNFSTSTGQITGTPTATLSATTFTVTATDQATPTPQTSSKTFSLTVNAALSTTQAVPSTTLTVNVAATPFIPVTASGGTGSVSFALSGGTLPTGLNFSTSTGQITGTPTVTLAATTFTVTATDQTTPTPQTSSKTFSLTVSAAGGGGGGGGGPPPPPQAVAKTVTTPANQALTIAVTQGDTGPISSIAVASPPTHGTATVNGLNVVYTPTANYSGPDSFTYTDTGPNGVSEPAKVTISVSALPAPTVVAQTAAVVSGQSVDINAATGAAGGPFTVAAIATQPDHGTAAANGQTLTYAAPANFSGTTTFTYTLANAFGVSAPGVVTVTVNPAPIVAPSTKVSLDAGQNGSLDLTVGATGGPFVSAAIVSISPAQAGTATITTVASAQASASAPGEDKAGTRSATTDGPHYILSFKPAARFSGVATVTFTLSNAFATSAPGQVLFTVKARPDPTLDPAVAGLIAAETEAARRFGEAQIENFDRRLETLHNGRRSGFANGLSLAGLSPDPVDPREVERRRREQGPWPIGPSNPAPAAATDAGKLASTGTSDQRKDTSDVAMWSGGAIDLGLHSGSAGRAKFRFTTSGVSFGADLRLNDELIVGAGAGYGHDASRIGGDGSKADADNYVGALYGSYRPGRNAFLDLVVGYGDLKFDTRRFVAADSVFATGQRHGQETFASITGGYDVQRGPMSFSTYGRLDSISGALDAFTETETGGGNNALKFDRQTLSVLTSTLGLRSGYTIRAGSWIWSPGVRLEYKYDFRTAGVASLQYADDLAGQTYSRTVDPLNRSRFAIEFGTGLHVHGMTFGLDYRANIDGRDEFVSQIIGKFGVQF